MAHTLSSRYTDVVSKLADLIIDNVANQATTRDPKPADRDFSTRERQKAWLAPRKAARKARKIAARQKQQEHQWAVEPAAETVSSERTQEMTRPQIGFSQSAQFLPSQQYQQGLSGYTSGHSELEDAAYQTQHMPNPLPARPLTWVQPSYSQAFPSPYHTPQHQPDYESGLSNTHTLPARPARASPNTASAPPAVKPRYRKIEMAEGKKFETYDQTVERVRGEERKKLEEEQKGVEEERRKLEWERKKMEEEWKKLAEEWKKIGQERKKFEEGKKVEEWIEGMEKK